MAMASFFAILIVLELLVSLPARAAAMAECGEVDRLIAPCLPYLVHRAWRPPLPCCVGTAAVRKLAGTDDDTKAVCECLKDLGSRVLWLDPIRVARLPALCGVGVPVPISASVNCSNIPTVLK